MSSPSVETSSSTSSTTFYIKPWLSIIQITTPDHQSSQSKSPWHDGSIYYKRTSACLSSASAADIVINDLLLYSNTNISYVSKNRNEVAIYTSPKLAFLFEERSTVSCMPHRSSEWCIPTYCEILPSMCKQRQKLSSGDLPDDMSTKPQPQLELVVIYMVLSLSFFGKINLYFLTCALL